MANGKTKKSRKKLFIFGGIGLLLIILIIIAFVSGGKDEIISVQTEKVVKRDITQTVAATGKINSEFKVVITPEVTGEIISLPVKEGDRVKKGDLLIKIKGDQYSAQKERLEAMLESAKANLSQSKAELDRMTLEYNRVKELHTKGLASDSELENAKSNFLSLQAAYEGAQANVNSNQASLKEIVDQLNKTTIRAPMDGVVTQLNVELGERVFGAGFSMGTDIMTISDLNNMEATVDVDENDVVIISLGDTANIKVDAFGDKVFKGLVTEIGNSAQTSGLGTQDQVVNFAVKIKLLELDSSLRPGMSCNADIETETKSNVVSVPIQCVTARGDFAPAPEGDSGSEDEPVVTTKKSGDNKIKEIVFLIKNGKAKSVEVETGISDDNYIEVKSGLSGDEEVVTGSYRAISRELNDDVVVRVENKSNSTEKK